MSEENEVVKTIRLSNGTVDRLVEKGLVFYGESIDTGLRRLLNLPVEESDSDPTNLKSVRVGVETYEALQKYGRMGESHDKVVRRVIEQGAEVVAAQNELVTKIVEKGLSLEDIEKMLLGLQS